MASVQGSIETKLDRIKKGHLIFPSDFRGLGSEAAIKMALSRLAKQGKLDRLAHGIYHIPKEDSELGKLKPSMEEIAKAVARHERVRILPSGVYALNKLGLSTQVPTRLVYITDGPSRMIKLGKGGIRFKATTAKKLALKGPVSSLIVLALDELGIENVSPAMKNRLTALLRKEDPKLLKHDLSLAPAKVHDYILQLLKEHKNARVATADE